MVPKVLMTFNSRCGEPLYWRLSPHSAPLEDARPRLPGRTSRMSWKVRQRQSWPAEGAFALWTSLRIVGWYPPSLRELLSHCTSPRDKEVSLGCRGKSAADTWDRPSSVVNQSSDSWKSTTYAGTGSGRRVRRTERPISWTSKMVGIVEGQIRLGAVPPPEGLQKPNSGEVSTQ